MIAARRERVPSVGSAGARVRALATALALTLLAPPAEAYRHHTSRIRYLEYSPDAFAQAKREQKPIFLVISAAWCYWCKYFDQQTLETEEVSGYLDRHYLSIFVDSDLRMDLTRRYARGWPMTVLFDPEGRIRLSFPGALHKEDFLAILKRVVDEVGSGLPVVQPADQGLAKVTAPLPVTLETYRQLLDGMARYLDEQVDPLHGGFGTGRKFPHGQLLAYLLERDEVTRERRRLAAVEKTLEGILRGLYDPVEGGFFRYAEQREWREPHTEKMLYVNASLALVFHRASQVFRNPRYTEVSDATVGYLLRTLHDARAGGFYGSQTAAPAYYRFPREERRAVRPPAVNRDKVTGWNAEAVLAFLALGQATGRQDLTDAALRSLDFMRRNLLTDKGVYHIHQQKTGRGRLRGQLPANAWAALAFFAGHQATGEAAYRRAAEQVVDYALAELFDAERGAFVEARDPDEQGAAEEGREFPLDANGLMAGVLLRAHRATGRVQYLEVAKRVLASLGRQAAMRLDDERDASAARGVADLVFYLRAYGELYRGS